MSLLSVLLGTAEFVPPPAKSVTKVLDKAMNYPPTTNKGNNEIRWTPEKVKAIFDGAAEPLSTTQIAERLGFNPTKAQGMLRHLQAKKRIAHKGYVRKGSTVTSLWWYE